jgi:hypothetical protein
MITSKSRESSLPGRDPTKIPELEGRSETPIYETEIGSFLSRRYGMFGVIIAEADHQKGALGIRVAAPMKVNRVGGKALHSKKLEGKEAQKGRSVRALVAGTACNPR